MSAADELRVAQQRLEREIASTIELPAGPYAERLARAIEGLIDAKMKVFLRVPVGAECVPVPPGPR